MEKINIKTSSEEYDIFLGEGIFSNIPCLVDEYKGRKAAVIFDTNINDLYRDKITEVFSKCNFYSTFIVIPAGEEHKNLDTVYGIYSRLCEEEITRKDLIIAIGGGVCGDISGFCSATYLRGIPYIQIPTTLLSFVDSSIGGKTGVDLPFGKNLVGAFKQPEKVIIDTDFLKTLPKEQLASGMAEIIKSGFIRDKELVDLLVLSSDFDKDVYTFIKRAINVKKEVVEKDEFEKNERMLLNFGHTFGHAIEKQYNFSNITHGRAVAEGMKIISEGTLIFDTLVYLLDKYNLSDKIEYNKSRLLADIRNDKKSYGDGINIVKVNRAGFGEIIKQSFEELGVQYE